MFPSQTSGPEQDKDEGVALSYLLMEYGNLTPWVVFKNTVDAPITSTQQDVVTNSSSHGSTNHWISRSSTLGFFSWTNYFNNSVTCCYKKIQLTCKAPNLAYRLHSIKEQTCRLLLLSYLCWTTKVSHLLTEVLSLNFHKRRNLLLMRWLYKILDGF